MTVLRDDNLSRGPRRSRLRGQPVSGLHLALLFAALALLVLSRIEHPIVVRLETTARDFAAGPLSLAARRLGSTIGAWLPGAERSGQPGSPPAERQLELARLKLAQLETRYAELQRIARLVPERPAPSLGVRVIARGTGRFARAITIDAGRDHALRPGAPVIDESGFIGHVVEVGEVSAKVLLLGDSASRIPVTVGGSRAHAIAVGDRDGTLRLEHLPRDAGIRGGDLVVTSGAGGLVPSGYVVGTVRQGDGDWQVVRSAPTEPGTFVRVMLPGIEATLPRPQHERGVTERRRVGALRGGDPLSEAARKPQ